MDLGLTGEIEEIDEGKEPAEFWSSFPQGAQKNNADGSSEAKDWHLKPTCEKYGTKLYEVDVEAPRPKSSSGFMSWGRRGSAPSTDGNTTLTAQIKEISPFTQADLTDDRVFVLDVFFEIFMYVGLSLHSQPFTDPDLPQHPPSPLLPQPRPPKSLHQVRFSPRRIAFRTRLRHPRRLSRRPALRTSQLGCPHVEGRWRA